MLKTLLPLSALRSLVLVALLAVAGVAAAAEALPAAVVAARDSAVRILALTPTGVRPICSGSVVALPEGPRVVSAGHCVDDAPEGRYLALDARGYRYVLTLERFVMAWPHADYAVFRSAAAHLLPALPLAPLRAPARGEPERCEVGEALYVWTAPLGLGLFLSHGYVAGVMDDYHTDDVIDGMVLVALNADKGSSGSVIVNARGEAVGILVGGFSPQSKLAGALMVPLPR